MGPAPPTVLAESHKPFDTMVDSNHPWQRKTILSLDGGGIRGLSQLLILQYLLKAIETVEHSHPDGRHTSSAQYDWYQTADDKTSTPSSTRHPFQPGFKLHHYFDYFIGTSTGGLSAIALGRLRMSVDAVISMYGTIGTEVFGKPQWRLRPKWTKLVFDKYSSKRFSKALATAFDKASPAHGHGLSNTSLKDMRIEGARTLVVTWGGDASWERHLLRSYDHPKPSKWAISTEECSKHLPTLQAFAGSALEAALATSAAPTYFQPLVFQDQTFFDGAVGEDSNNPVFLGYHEVKQMHHEEPANITSIGTGILTPDNTYTPGKTFLQKLNLPKAMAKSVGNSDNIHRRFIQHLTPINKLLLIEGTPGILYQRFNLPFDASLGGISTIKLDSWDPPIDGSKTTAHIQASVNHYLRDPHVQREMYELAEFLVDLRRQRAKTEAWENKALDHVYYECPSEQKCRRTTRFPSRKALRCHYHCKHPGQERNLEHWLDKGRRLSCLAANNEVIS